MNQVQTEQQAPLEVYAPYRAQLAEFKQLNSSLVFDYESKQGDKDARSHIYQMRQGKAAVDRARKAAKQESLEYGRRVDAEAKDIISEIESMIEVHQSQLDLIANRERERVEALQERVSKLDYQNYPPERESKGIAKVLKAIKAVKIDDSFEEFEDTARQTQATSITALEEHLAKAKQQEEEQAELAALRAEKAEREAKEREEQMRADAERLAEENAKAERERLEREKADIEKRKRAAEREAKRLKKEADARAAKAKAAADAIEALDDAITTAGADHRGVIELDVAHAETLLELLRQ